VRGFTSQNVARVFDIRNHKIRKFYHPAHSTVTLSA
jgi:hypothetical protein